MPKTAAGKEMFGDFLKRYGKKRGERIFYSTANKKGSSSTFYKMAHGTK